MEALRLPKVQAIFGQKDHFSPSYISPGISSREYHVKEGEKEEEDGQFDPKLHGRSRRHLIFIFSSFSSILTHSSYLFMRVHKLGDGKRLGGVVVRSEYKFIGPPCIEGGKICCYQI